MATFVTTSPKIWLGQYAIDANAIGYAFNYGAELQDDTVFGDTTRSRAGGLKTLALNVEGYFDGSLSDPAAFAKVGVADSPVTIAPEGGTENNVSFAALVNVGTYSPGGAVGEMYKFSIDGEASGGVGPVKGVLLGNRTSTGTENSTAYNFGSTSGKTAYAAIHLTSITGGTLTVKVQSDTSGAMSSPVNLISFTALTAIGSEWLSAAGNADSWHRLNITYTGTTCTFSVFFGTIP